jgi:hypothetical protein
MPGIIQSNRGLLGIEEFLVYCCVGNTVVNSVLTIRVVKIAHYPKEDS